MTYQKLYASKGDIRVPSFNNRLGHPMFLSKRMIKEILEEDSNSTLKEVRNRHQITYVLVDDPNILQDIDTLSDYQKTLNEEGEDIEN